MTERTATGTEVHMPPPPASTTHVTIVAPQHYLERRTDEIKFDERPAGVEEEQKEALREHERVVREQERKETFEHEQKITMTEEKGMQSTITITLPAPILKIEMAEPIVCVSPPKETSVKVPPTTIFLETSAPKVEMEQQHHEVRITPPAPIINVSSPHPVVNTEPAREINIQPPAAVINVTTPQPIVRMEQVSHEVSITPPAPLIKVHRATPIVDIDQKSEGCTTVHQQYPSHSPLPFFGWFYLHFLSPFVVVFPSHNRKLFIIFVSCFKTTSTTFSCYKGRMNDFSSESSRSHVSRERQNGEVIREL
jgi:hypothetical protein